MPADNATSDPDNASETPPPTSTAHDHFPGTPSVASKSPETTAELSPLTLRAFQAVSPEATERVVLPKLVRHLRDLARDSMHVVDSRREPRPPCFAFHTKLSAADRAREHHLPGLDLTVAARANVGRGAYGYAILMKVSPPPPPFSLQSDPLSPSEPLVFKVGGPGPASAASVAWEALVHCVVSQRVVVSCCCPV